MSVVLLPESTIAGKDEVKEKPSASEVLALALKELKDKVENLSNLFKERVPKQIESPAIRVNEMVDSIQQAVKSLKESGDYISLNLSNLTFKEIKNAMESLNKSVKDMTFAVSGLDVRVKGVNDLLSSVVRNTKELSEDVKSNTALMNMLMRALETKNVERENLLLKNLQTSTELIEQFTLLVRSETPGTEEEK
jgi:methyl-accepting chemotaxis protein